MWNKCEINVKQLWNKFETTMKQMWNKCETKVKQMWKNVKQMRNKCETNVKQMWNNVRSLRSSVVLAESILIPVSKMKVLTSFHQESCPVTTGIFIRLSSADHLGVVSRQLSHRSVCGEEHNSIYSVDLLSYQPTIFFSLTTTNSQL